MATCSGGIDELEEGEVHVLAVGEFVAKADRSIVKAMPLGIQSQAARMKKNESPQGAAESVRR